MPIKTPLLLLLLAQTTTLSSQYDAIVSSLKLPVANSPATIEGDFEQKYQNNDSQLCFGDYNADEKLDFLEIRYDPEWQDDDVFRVTFSTLNEKGFERDANKYLVFKRWYGGDYSLNTTILVDQW